MAMPKSKYELNINPPKIGNEFLEYGSERVNELLNKTDLNTKYLPKTILLEDLDQSIYDYVNDDTMTIIIDGKKTPVFYLTLDRWGELSKTWQFTDDDKNVPTPYITIRRTEKQPGTRLGTKYRIPNPRKFRYLNVPILDAGQVIYLQFRTPEPTNVDLTYEISLFTKYIVDVNQYDEQILKIFASRQNYVSINNTPFPILFEGFSETNSLENIEGDRFFISKYTIKLLGYIQDEKEFEVVKTVRKPRIGYFIG
jgi:hypothetical protein